MDIFCALKEDFAVPLSPTPIEFTPVGLWHGVLYMVMLLTIHIQSFT